MGRPRKPPTTVVRLPAELVSRIDELRGDRSRAEYLDDLVPAEDELHGESVAVQRRENPPPIIGRGSPSPSLGRFGR